MAKKTSLLCGAALIAAFGSVPAFAQDAPQNPTALAPEETQAQDEGYGNDIIVTATRRSETVQDVPVAITAVGNELLENAGVKDIRGLEQLAPSLQTTTGQSAATGSSLSIRGIGTGGDNPGFEPAVGVFIDGVFRSRAGVALSELPELERVEVLRGPQGTLFGRNTSAGALSIFTAKPQFEFGGYIEGSYGNYDAYELKGAVTGPVTDQIALRLDGGWRQRDGYIKDANSDRRINDLDRYYVRGQALIDAGDLTFRLIGDYTETDEKCCGAVNVVPGSFAPIIDAIAGAQGLDGIYTGPPSDRTMAISPNREFGERVKDWGVSGELNYDLGDFSLTSITAYRDWRALRNQDIDFSGIDRAYREGYRVDLTDFTQELRFQGTLGPVDFLLGGFYLNEKLDLRDTVRIGNDGNRYVDSIFSAALRPTFGTGLQFYGSLPGQPLFGQALLGTPTAAFPAALQPLVTLFKAQAGVAPIAGIPVIPGLAALATTPLPGATPGQGNNDDDFAVDTQAFAIFTHNIVNLSDRLKLTLGLRYNYEKKDLTASINNNLGSCGFFNQVRAGNAAAVAYANVLRQVGLFNNLFLLSCNPAVNTEFNGTYTHDRSESEFTGTAKLAYEVSNRILVYGSYDRGYKSGGYNLDQATFDSVLLGGNGAQGSDLEFGKETVDSYELGLKTQLSRAFSLNVAAFYGKYKNLQSLVFSGNNFVVQNIPSSTSKGVEAESIIQPSRDLTFRLGYTYLKAVYDKDNVLTGALAGLEGQQIQNQPRHVVTASGTFQPDLGGGLKGLLHVDMRYNSEVEIAGVNPLQPGRGFVRNQGYPLVSARVGVGNESGTIRGEFFVENLTNQYYNITGFAVPEQTGTYAGYPSTPRFYGVRARFGF